MILRACRIPFLHDFFQGHIFYRGKELVIRACQKPPNIGRYLTIIFFYASQIVLRNSKEPRLPVQKNRDLRGSKEMDEINSNKKVMVAIDDSESSHGALEWALQNLHQKITSSGLLLFHAISIDYGGIYAGTYGGAPAELLTSIQENREKLANALLGKAKDICANHGIVAETVSIIGEPKESICDAVEKMHIELLVVGSHGRKGLQRAFLGSVSNYCVHHAKCPVLVVRKAA